MRHTIITVLLTLGVVFGLGLGFLSLRHHSHGHHRQQFEEHIADICVGAAERRHRQCNDSE